MSPSLETRERAFIYGLLGLSALLVIGPVLSPGTTLYFRDHLLVFRNGPRAVVEAYSRGDWPLWNPYLGGGEVLAAYPAAMAYSPFLFVFWLWPDFHDAYDAFVVLRVPFALWGVYLFGRFLSASRVGACLGALVWGSSGLFLSYENLLPAFESLAFAPWAHLMTGRLLKKPSLKGVCAQGLFLAWHVQCADPAFLFCDVLLFGAYGGPMLRGLSPRQWVPKGLFPGCSGNAASSLCKKACIFYSWTEW